MDLGESVGWLRGLIRDRDPFFTAAFAEVFMAEGLWTITMLPRRRRLEATRRPQPAPTSTPSERRSGRPVVTGAINDCHRAA
ncbi:hypothetical protein [Actinomadura rugatobispora]|uniref:Uncharacterized protein n=1 Tax=Actinomadura rugatobispora TaxID=1994 RepID=A0ABW1ABQ3_9ACTN|nr:hypothetical protein GCM10010200_082000 [Actinomadura rugatobispora]